MSAARGKDVSYQLICPGGINPRYEFHQEKNNDSTTKKNLSSVDYQTLVGAKVLRHAATQPKSQELALWPIFISNEGGAAVVDFSLNAPFYCGRVYQRPKLHSM